MSWRTCSQITASSPRGLVEVPEQGPFPRPLTDVEKAVVRRVLELDCVAELDILSEQLQAAVAVAPCGCPCPTVTIEVDHTKARPIARPCIDASAEWERGGSDGGIAHGWLNELEIWWGPGDAPLEFPPLTDIRRFEGTRGGDGSGLWSRFRSW